MEDNLSVVEVVSSNIGELWPHLLSAIHQASFIALDIEMSGLGEKKKLFYPEIDVRYKYIAELAHSHAPVSLGISCFRCTSASGQGEQYSVESYDLFVLSESQFCVQSNSLKFLRSHGFDFNKLVDDGIPYTPGCDLHVVDAQSKKSSKLTSNGSTPSSLHCSSTSASKFKVHGPTANASRTSRTQNGSSESQSGIYINSNSNNSQPNVRALFAYIIQHPKPIVLHNGLVDLVFLYQHFYAELPKSSETFAANLCEMFPLGIYDTKYFSEFVYRDPASYLQIVYLQERLLNDMACDEGRPSVGVNFGCTFSSLPGVRQFCLQSKLQQQQRTAAPLCSSYAYHGWCERGDRCSASHDLQRIVRQLLFKANQLGGQKLRNPARRSNAGPNSTGTSAMLVSALKHNARHQKLTEDKNLSRSRSTADNLRPRASIGCSDAASQSVTSLVATQNGTTDVTNDTADVTDITTDVTDITADVTNDTTDVTISTTDSSVTRSAASRRQNGQRCRASTMVRTSTCSVASAELPNGSLSAHMSCSGCNEYLARNADTSNGLSPKFSTRTSSTYLNGVSPCAACSNTTSITDKGTHISNEFTSIPNNAANFTSNSTSESSETENGRNVTSLATDPLDATCTSPNVTAKCIINSRGIRSSERSKRSLSREKECTAESDSAHTSLEALGKNRPSSENILHNETSICSPVRKRRLVDVSDEGCKLQYLNGCKAGLSERGTESILESKGVCMPDTRSAEDQLNSTYNDSCKPSEEVEINFKDVSETDGGCTANSRYETARKVGPSPKKFDAPIVIGLDGDGHVKKDEKSYSDTNEIESQLIKNEALTAAAVGSLSEGHSAGIDAFKTGFIFASYIRRAGKLRLALNEPLSTSCKGSIESAYPNSYKGGVDSNSESCGLPATDKSPTEGSGDGFTPHALGLTGEINKVYLMGKNFPFLVRKSPFVKAYKNHVDKIKSIRLEGM